MDTTIKKKSYIQPKTIAELLPSLSGILSKDAMQTLTAKKAPRQTVIQTRTAEKVMKPLTIAEMKADLLSLRVKSPKVLGKTQNSMKKRNWNSSVKLEHKTKSCTGVGQLKENSVRKVLNFQTKATPRARQTMISMETNKFAKPESRPKRTAVERTNNIRISGVCDIHETPIFSNKGIKDRMSIASKENNMNRINRVNHIKKIQETPKSFNKMKSFKAITPLNNMSFKSNSDASFLQKEEEINKFEEKIQAIAEEKTLENISDVSPLVSTPFKEYRNVEQFFNNSKDMDNSILHNDNTIMSFDIPQVSNKEESVIVSLCDLLNKTQIQDTKAKSENANTELNDLLEIEKQTEQSVKMIECGIKILTNIKESHIKSLHYVQKLINEKKNNNTAENNMDKTLVDEVIIPSTELVKQERLSLEESFTRPTVIKMKSPSYKIPRKSLCLRKKVFHKSMPNVSNKTPNKDTDKALDMYMQMKQKMNFLNTPVVKHHHNVMQPDTPAITSHNLKKQLDKLFNCS